jgi:hypothetical protein
MITVPRGAAGHRIRATRPLLIRQRFTSPAPHMPAGRRSRSGTASCHRDHGLPSRRHQGP